MTDTAVDGALTDGHLVRALQDSGRCGASVEGSKDYKQRAPPPRLLPDPWALAWRKSPY